MVRGRPAVTIEEIVDVVHDRLVRGARPRPDDIAAAVRVHGSALDAAQQAEVQEQVTGRLRGLGLLGELFADPLVTDILIQGPGPVVIERAGALLEHGAVTAVELDRLVEFLLGATGRRVDRSNPVVDVRIDERTRCQVVVPPVSVDGVCVSLRRFPDRVRDLEEFATPSVASQLRDLVASRSSLVVFGPTGAGKTSLLAALLARVHHDERIVVVEEAAELPRLAHRHVRLEGQPANLDGVGGVTPRELVAAALRMRPDRLVVGEVRGVEAAAFLHALGTGHRGSMGTVHAQDIAGCLWRLEDLARAGGATGDTGGQLVRSLDWAVEMARGAAGQRRVIALHRVSEA